MDDIKREEHEKAYKKEKKSQGSSQRESWVARSDGDPGRLGGVELLGGGDLGVWGE